MLRLLLTFLLLTACSKPNKAVLTSSPLDEVKAKRDLYMKLAIDQRDEYGWLKPKCDGLLFNSLAAYAGFPVDPLIAEKEPGLWERHPSFDCFTTGQSRSTISKDMFAGLFLYLLQQHDRENIKEIKEYCDNHEILAGTACVMGQASDLEAYWGRVVFNPAQRIEMARMLKMRIMTEATEIDFESHLDVLRIYRSYWIDKGLSDGDVNRLKAHAARQPNNAMFQILAHKFTDGNQEQALGILKNEAWFPSDRLPTTKERKADYLWQREEGQDWLPCPDCEEITHPGIDLMIAVKLLEDE